MNNEQILATLQAAEQLNKALNAYLLQYGHIAANTPEMQNLLAAQEDFEKHC